MIQRRNLQLALGFTILCYGLMTIVDALTTDAILTSAVIDGRISDATFTTRAEDNTLFLWVGLGGIFVGSFLAAYVLRPVKTKKVHVVEVPDETSDAT
jgi:hypothetical protein